jgi:hypothetical protein
VPDCIPLGHSIPSHVVHGWCCLCPGKTADDEVNAWRLWSMTNVPEVDEAVSRNGKR